MRIRNDLLTVSVGQANINLLRETAARKDLPVSALVRELVSTLADKGADNGGE